MNAGAKLAAYGLVLVAILGGGAAVGSAVGPIDVGSDEEGGHGGAEAEEERALPAGGLLVAQDGYRLVMADRVLDADRPERLSFVIEGPAGRPMMDYELLHDRELHFVVVSRDLGRFAHVHPVRDAAGTWSVELPAQPAGSYRAYADFQPEGGEQLTLGTDITVPGPLGASQPPSPRRQVEVDGYQATLDGDPTAGDSSVLTVTIRRDGQLITTEPYLGAAGHLVAIRDGDMAYLHVHPIDEEPSGPVRFAVEAPSAGTYGLYFDFAHDGTVRTAAFAVVVGDKAQADSGGDTPSTTTVEGGADHGTGTHGTDTPGSQGDR